MLKQMSIIAVCSTLVLGVPVASAMTATECAVLSAELGPAIGEFQKADAAFVVEQEELDRLREEAEDAERMVAISKDTEGADLLAAEYDDRKSDYNARYSEHVTTGQKLQADRAAFVADCTKFFKK